MRDYTPGIAYTRQGGDVTYSQLVTAGSGVGAGLELDSANAYTSGDVIQTGLLIFDNVYPEPNNCAIELHNLIINEYHAGAGNHKAMTLLLMNNPEDFVATKNDAFSYSTNLVNQDIVARVNIYSTDYALLDTTHSRALINLPNREIVKNSSNIVNLYGVLIAAGTVAPFGAGDTLELGLQYAQS